MKSTDKPIYKVINLLVQLENDNTFYPALDEQTIDDVINQLIGKAIQDYKELLCICNGATLFNGDIEIWGCINEEIPYEDQPAFDVIENNMPELRWPNMPSELIAIASYSYGDVICLDVLNNDYRIVSWDHETGSISNRWATISDWLQYEINIPRNA